MKSSLPLKTRLLCLEEVLNSLFSSIGQNQRQISGVLLQMKDLRREHVQQLYKDLPEKIGRERESGAKILEHAEVIQFLQKVVNSAAQDQSKAYQLIEQGIWREILEKVGREALEKKLPELAFVSEELRNTREQRDSLLAEKQRLEADLDRARKTAEAHERECDSLKGEVGTLAEKNRTLAAKVEACGDYQNIIGAIRRELEGKKESKTELDTWRLKVLYNRVSSLTRSSWTYPGVPKPDLYIPQSEEALKFLESL